MSDIASLLQEGIASHQAGRLREAESAYRRLLAIQPKHVEASFLLGSLLDQSGRADLALPLLRTAVDGDPGQVRYLNALGGVLLKLGKLEEALALFQTATRNHPDQAELHARLGLLYHKKGQAAEAVACYQQALARNPDNVQAQSNLGILLFQLGQTEEAIVASRRAIALLPTHAKSYGNLGYALVKQGKTAEGIAAFRRAVELQPNQVDIHAGLVSAYLQAGDAAAAQRAARDARRHVGFCSSILAYETCALHESRDDAAVKHLMDFDRMIFADLLPLPHEFSSLEEFNTALASEMRAHPSLMWEPIGKTTRGGRQSANLIEQPTPLSRIFERTVRQKIDTLIRSLPIDPQHPLYGRKPNQYRLHMWVTILEAGGFQDPHFHAGGWLSGVYYVELPSTVGSAEQDNAGWIEFGRAPAEFPLRRAPNVKTVQPRTGLYILFPSWFFHRTIPFPPGGQRISIAFDVVI